MKQVFKVQAYWNGSKWSAYSDEGGNLLSQADTFAELVATLEQELPTILGAWGLWPSDNDELRFMVKLTPT